MPKPLTETEKAYFDTIKYFVSKSTRPADLALLRMELDGKPVAAIVQKIIDNRTAEFRGAQPLALIVTEDQLDRLRLFDGSGPESVNPNDVEGA